MVYLFYKESNKQDLYAYIAEMSYSDKFEGIMVEIGESLADRVKEDIICYSVVNKKQDLHDRELVGTFCSQFLRTGVEH